MKKFLLLSLSAYLMLNISSCTKVEGEGGTSTIKGKINIQKYNSVGTLVAEYPGEEQDIYIIYGSGKTFYNDDIKTSYDGSFEFNYLEKGDYTIFTYEDCNTCASGKLEVLVTTKITDKKSTVDLGTINVKEQ